METLIANTEEKRTSKYFNSLDFIKRLKREVGRQGHTVGVNDLALILNSKGLVEVKKSRHPIYSLHFYLQSQGDIGNSTGLEIIYNAETDTIEVTTNLKTRMFLEFGTKIAASSLFLASGFVLPEQDQLEGIEQQESKRQLLLSSFRLGRGEISSINLPTKSGETQAFDIGNLPFANDDTATPAFVFEHFSISHEEYLLILLGYFCGKVNLDIGQVYNEWLISHLQVIAANSRILADEELQALAGVGAAAFYSEEQNGIMSPSSNPFRAAYHEISHAVSDHLRSINYERAKLPGFEYTFNHLEETNLNYALYSFAFGNWTTVISEENGDSFNFDIFCPEEMFASIISFLISPTPDDHVLNLTPYLSGLLENSRLKDALFGNIDTTTAETLFHAYTSGDMLFFAEQFGRLLELNNEDIVDIIESSGYLEWIPELRFIQHSEPVIDNLRANKPLAYNGIVVLILFSAFVRRTRLRLYSDYLPEEIFQGFALHRTRIEEETDENGLKICSPIPNIQWSHILSFEGETLIPEHAHQRQELRNRLSLIQSHIPTPLHAIFESTTRVTADNSIILMPNSPFEWVIQGSSVLADCYGVNTKIAEADLPYTVYEKQIIRIPNGELAKDSLTSILTYFYQKPYNLLRPLIHEELEVNNLSLGYQIHLRREGDRLIRADVGEQSHLYIAAFLDSDPEPIDATIIAAMDSNGIQEQYSLLNYKLLQVALIIDVLSPIYDDTYQSELVTFLEELAEESEDAEEILSVYRELISKFRQAFTLESDLEEEEEEEKLRLAREFLQVLYQPNSLSTLKIMGGKVAALSENPLFDTNSSTLMAEVSIYEKFLNTFAKVIAQTTQLNEFYGVKNGGELRSSDFGRLTISPQSSLTLPTSLSNTNQELAQLLENIHVSIQYG